MKISLNWLRQHIAITEPAETLAEMLTSGGLEVEGFEGISSVKGGLRDLLVGEVLSCEPIPDTNHLSRTKVAIGNGVVLPIVCGAPNVAAGQKVVVAPPGCTIYPIKGEPFTIGKRKLKGELSEGMICAEDEIGLGHDHAGILILDASLEPGTLVSDVFHIEQDEIIEIGLTANRGDAASHRGVARDLSAITNRPLISIETTYTPFTGINTWKIEIKDEACPRYTGLLMDNVSIKESPEWLKNRLRSIGLNPINNIVDITNFVLHDLGQPIHAFDADQVKGQKIVVKKGFDGHEFITLDGEKRTLHQDDLMICDTEGPMAIAGVFGGKFSGVSAATSRIFIESAYFNPTSIRKTSKRHGLNTDASFRYERGADPDITMIAIARVAALVEEIAGGKAASYIMDVYPHPIHPVRLILERTYLDQLLGVHIPEEEVERILKKLEIEVLETSDSGWSLSIPPFKSDVTRPADVVEELIRIYGLDKIPVPERVMTSFSNRQYPDPQASRKKMADVLVNRGFYEITTNSMTSSRLYEAEITEKAVWIKNPLSSDMEIMRPALLPSLLQVLAHNKNRRNSDLKLFELGKVYFKNAEGSYFEEERLGMIAAGNWTLESWHSEAEPADMHLLKQEVEIVLERMGMRCKSSKWSFEPFNRFESSKAWIQISAISPGLLKRMDIQGPVFYAELNWNRLIDSIQTGVRMLSKPVPKFPAVRRDLSLVLDSDITMTDLNKVIQSADKDLIRQVNVFDVYEGDKIGEGKKAYSLSFLLQDDEKTLSDKEIDALMNRLIVNFEKQAGAIIRK